METRTTDVLVVGGGISGLTVAWHLHRAGIDVALLEAEKEVGGVTRSELRDGFTLEKGPFNVIVRDPTFESLLDQLAPGVGVVSADRAARKRYIYRHGRIHAVPSNPVSLATTSLLRFGGRLHLVSGLLLSPRAKPCEETIEQVATRRFGRDVSDTMISAVIAGIFAGDIRKLSLSACFPGVAAVDRDARSLIGYGLRKALGGKRGARPKRRYKGLVTIEGGLGAMTAALGRPLGTHLIAGARAESIEESAEGYEITYGCGDEAPASIRCRRLVVACPAAETARLLAPLLPEVSRSLASIESTSLVVVNLAFRRTHVGHPMEGFGFLVPHDEREFPLMGVLWADSIFPHHAPEEHRLMRVFIGGAHDVEAADRSDDELLQMATHGIRGLLGVSGDPTLVDICRHSSAIPQYHVGHTEKINRIVDAVAARPGLHLAGNYLRGVSLNDCVREATGLAEQLISERESVRHDGAARQGELVEPTAV